MIKYFFIIIIFLISCAPTEPVEKHDDLSVLQDFINNSSETLLATLDTDSSGVIEPLELGEQTWNNNGRIIILNCDSIGLSGRIPESIGTLTELKQLGLKNNNLSGEIRKSIGNLTQLTQLSLSKNSLSGAIPDTIGNLKSLWWLDLSYNQLSGTLPGSLSNLSILEVLLANSNNLSGVIPQDICIIYNPNYNFELSGNQFCPPLPYCIDSPNLIGYQNCDTSCGSGNTYLNGYCYSQTDLDVLQGLIDSANSLNMDMDTDTISGVQSLELGLQEWQSGRLKTLDCYWEADKCNLSGPLPSNIGNLDSLEYLDVQQNNITGGIPETLAELSALYTFSADSNSFSGSIPDGLCNIENLDISDNQFCPCYPSCIEDAGVQDISECIICENGFEQVCTVPSSAIIDSDSTECFNSAHLEVLRAIIDSSLATLPDSLDYLMDADSSGTIEPMELGSQFWENSLLTYLDVNNRGLSGRLPNSILDLNSLFVLNLAHNYLDGEIPLNICYFVNLLPLNWDASISSGLNSNLFNNRFCPPYPDCIAPYVGEQNTSNCP